MNPVHKVLERQIKKFFGETTDILGKPEFEKFLETVSETYTHFDEDHTLIERSLDLSSKELTDKASLLEATLNATTDGILVVNHGGQIINYNKRFTTMWKIPGIVLTSKDQNTVFGLLTNQLKDPENFLKKITDLLNDTESESYDTVEFQDGRVFERFSQPQRLGEQVSVGRVWSFRDITDRKHAEEKDKKQTEDLKKSTEQAEKFAAAADQERNLYMLLLSSIGEGVLVLDMDRNITLVNRTAESILGNEAKELVGKKFDTLLKFFHANKTPLETSFWDNAYTSTGPQTLPRDIVVTGKKEAVPIASIVSPILDLKTRNITGLIMTLRDVRDERALEESRISFISIASHQLRTPLTSMRWFSEMLIGGDAGIITEEQKHFVERIYQGTDRMIALVNLLLQIARVEAGRLKIEPVPIDFNNIIRGLSVALKSLLDSKSVTIEVKTDPTPFPTVPMDQEVIWQVLQNLLSNAARYTAPKSVIKVSVFIKDQNIVCSVKDNGIGIPNTQKERIFEKFFRAENALKLVPEGSGLGLSLVKSLVEGWGGKIWFESEEGMGATFFFTIPLKGMEARQGEVKLSI